MISGARPGRPSVVVIGGGLSGLTAAWRLRQAGLQVTLLEGRPRTGGVLYRATLGDETDSPVMDFGAESMLARRPEAIALAAALGLADELEPPSVARACIYSGGVLHPMPTGHLMGVPGDAEALSGLLTPDEVCRLRAGLESAGDPVTADLSVGDWLSGRLGRPVVTRLVEPLLGGVYAGQVDRLSLQATMAALWPVARSGEPIGPAVRRFLAATQQATSPVVGLRGGVARLAEALTTRLLADGVQVRLGTSATGLARTADGRWSVQTGPAWGPHTLTADGVLLAVPAPAAAKLLGTDPVTASAAKVLAGVEVASMVLVAAGLPAGTLPAGTLPAGTRAAGTLAAATSAHRITGPSSGVLVPSTEGRLVKAMTFTSAKWGWASGHGQDLLRLSMGRAGEAAMLQRDDDSLALAAVADAEDILGVRLPVIARRVIRWGGGLPQYAPGHVQLVEQARGLLAPVRGLQVCGSVWDGVGIAACIATAEASAARLTAEFAGLTE